MQLVIDEAIGTPGEDVTHWGISRVTGHSRPESGGARRKLSEKVDYPDARGIRVDEWPLDQLTIETVRERWGDGTFRVHFLILDPENENPQKRRRSAGNGPYFTLDPERATPEPPAVVPTQPVIIQPPQGAGVGDMLQIAKEIFSLSAQMAQRPLPQPAPADDAIAGLRAELAEMRARAEADRERRELEDRHRADREKDAERIRELERERDRAREEAEAEDDRPPFEAGVPITEQLPAIAANVIATIALKNPEAAKGLLEWGYEKFFNRSEAKSQIVPRETVAQPPPPVAQPQPPRPAPTRPNAPHVRVVPAEPRPAPPPQNNTTPIPATSVDPSASGTG